MNEVGEGLAAPGLLHGPDPIGMSVVEVRGISGARIEVRALGMLDGTPILDIKLQIEVGCG